MKPKAFPSFRHCLLVCFALALPACGNKGSLTLPTPQTTPPAKAAVKNTSAPKPTSQPSDHISPSADASR